MKRRLVTTVILLIAALFTMGAYVRELDPNAAFDAFGRQRTSNPVSLWEGKFSVDKRSDVWDEVTTGSGTSATFNTNQASVNLAVSVTTAGSIRRQSHVRFPYQNGKSQLIVLTATIDTTTAGNTKRFGQYDDQNGYFFQHESTGLSVGIRSFATGSAVDTTVAEGDFDGSCAADFMTGFDETKTHIFAIDYQWLGSGNVRFSAEDDNGALCLLYTFKFSNLASVVYLSNPTLPISYEIENSGTGGADTFTQICSQISSEGGSQFTGHTMSADTGITALTTGVDTSIYPVICIRMKSTHWRIAHIDVTNFNFFSDEATQSIRAGLVIDPTIAGTALSFSSVAGESPVEVATPTNATTISAEGVLIATTYVSTGNNNSGQSVESVLLGSPLHLGVDPAGVSDIACVMAQNLTANASDFYGSLSWREIH